MSDIVVKTRSCSYQRLLNPIGVVAVESSTEVCCCEAGNDNDNACEL